MHKLGKKGIDAIHLFNEGDLRECHYVLEKLWVESKGEKKSYIQGLVQIIAAIFKVRLQPNWVSAKRLLAKGVSRIQEVDPLMVELDIRRLQEDALKLAERIDRLGPDRFTEITDEVLLTMYFRAPSP